MVTGAGYFFNLIIYFILLMFRADGLETTRREAQWLGPALLFSPVPLI